MSATVCITFNSTWPCIIIVCHAHSCYSLRLPHWYLIFRKMSQINEFIAHMEKPFTHLPMVYLSLISTQRYVYASHSIRRFIFISVAAWYIVYRVAWAWHTSLLRTETIRTSLSEMVNEWTTVNFLCSFHSDYYIFFYTFGGKSQRRLNERELLFPSIVREVFNMIKKKKNQVKFSLNILHGAVNLKMWMNGEKNKS